MSEVADVAIVGLGSRGLTVLERVITLAARTRASRPSGYRLLVAIVDPAGTGCGVHCIDAPEYLLLNTPCGQVSMFPNSATVAPDTVRAGPSLYGWARARGCEIRPTDYLPRRVLGEYLAWFYKYLLRAGAEFVQVILYRTVAVDLCDAPDSRRAVVCADGTTVLARQVFLTTGHTPNRPAKAALPGSERRIDDPYPMPGRLAVVAPGDVVAVAGLGLTAMDVIACLTIGRGGRFTGTDGEPEYVRGGSEPTMLLYSRSGAPYRARPRSGRDEPAEPPLVLTTDAVDHLRRHERGGLDFRRDILPLVLTEMRLAYRRTAARIERDRDVLALLDRLRGMPAPDRTAAAEAALDDLDARFGRFDPWAALHNEAGMDGTDGAGYQQWLARTVRRDLTEGALPLDGSPLKAAIEAVEDYRDVVRYAVDYGGLTGASHDDFMATFVPLFNRAVVGPQWERHAELLALLAAGVVRAPLGPAPLVNSTVDGRWVLTARGLCAEGKPVVEGADWLIAARVSAPSVDDSASPLVVALHARGHIRSFRPVPGRSWGIDIDPDHHPLNRRGEPDRQVWVLGTLCEGRTYYTNLVPFPEGFCRPVFDAHRCVAGALESLSANDRLCTEDVAGGLSIRP